MARTLPWSAQPEWYDGCPGVPVRPESVAKNPDPIVERPLNVLDYDMGEFAVKVTPMDVLLEKGLEYIGQMFRHNGLYVMWLGTKENGCIVRRRKAGTSEFEVTGTPLPTIVASILGNVSGLGPLRTPLHVSKLIDMAELRDALPVFKPHPDVLSFTDACLHLPTGKSIPHGRLGDTHPFMHIAHPLPTDLHCPNLLALARHQHWSQATLFWFLAVIGFVQHKAGANKVMMIPFFWGVPRSGKSVWLDILSSMVPDGKVYALMPYSTNQFTFSQLHMDDKVWLITGNEIAGNHKLSRDTLTSVLSGDRFAAEQKHGEITHAPCYTPAILAGNSSPAAALEEDSKADHKGAVSRRMMVFPFLRAFTDDNSSTAKQDVVNGPELGKLMIAGAMCYAYALAHTGSLQGWGAINGPASEQLRVANAAFMGSKTVKKNRPPPRSVMEFLKHCAVFDRNAEVPVQEFLAAYAVFCTRAQLPLEMGVTTFTQAWVGHMRAMGVERVRATHTTDMDHKKASRPWVLRGLHVHEATEIHLDPPQPEQGDGLAETLDSFIFEPSPLDLSFLGPGLPLGEPRACPDLGGLVIPAEPMSE